MVAQKTRRSVPTAQGRSEYNLCACLLKITSSHSIHTIHGREAAERTKEKGNPEIAARRMQSSNPNSCPPPSASKHPRASLPPPVYLLTPCARLISSGSYGQSSAEPKDVVLETSELSSWILLPATSSLNLSLVEADFIIVRKRICHSLERLATQLMQQPRI